MPEGPDLGSTRAASDRSMIGDGTLAGTLNLNDAWNGMSNGVRQRQADDRQRVEPPKDPGPRTVGIMIMGVPDGVPFLLPSRNLPWRSESCTFAQALYACWA